MHVVFLSFLLFLLHPLLATANGTTTKIDISLHSESHREKSALIQLRQILDKHNLNDLIFTDKVIIQDHVIPHSHPILTLNTRHLENDDLQLATFIHEQMHWFIRPYNKSLFAAVSDLQRIYIKVPVKGGQGAINTYSTYLHLLINTLEYDSLVQVLGRKKARDVLRQKDYYIWIYKTVLEDENRIRSLLMKHGLVRPAKE